jgi:hypothetical protein
VGAGLSHPQHFEVASALLRVTIIKLMDAMAQMQHHFQPAGRTSAPQDPSRLTSSIANRPNQEINSIGEISRTDS